MPAYDDILKHYIPDAAVSGIMALLHSANVQLKITRNRSSKLGDYRPPFKVKYHKISVNHDLNPYHFLLTLVHEFAHLKVWEQYKNKVAPHGKEWKSEFRNLMLPFLNENVYPVDLLAILNRYMKNPGASTSNTDLLKHLRKYDRNNNFLTLDDLPENAVFSIHNGFVFQKLEKLRKRYKCRRMDNQRIYLVSPLIEVKSVE